MKLKEAFSSSVIRQMSSAGLLMVFIMALTLETVSLIQYTFSRKGIREEAYLRAESQLEATRNRIMDVVNQTESAVRNSVWIAQWCLDVPDSLFRVAQRIVEDNPVVMGSTVAMVPGYLKSRPLYAPYVFRNEGSLEFSSLATESYDYPSKEWFSEALDKDSGYWSEPYVDIGGGNVLMTTFSMPIKDSSGNVAAILTADMSLDWLSEMVGNIKVYPNAFSMMLSRTGRIMVCPVDSFVMSKTVREAAEDLGDTAAFSGLNNAMLAGESGSMPVRYNGITNLVYFAPLERTGWSMSIVIPEDEIFGSIKRIGLIVTILQIIGLGLLILMIRFIFQYLLQFHAMTEKKERMENELSIASGIQMAMIPKIFPPFPERTDLDMSAAIVPAKEVGGDLYDFFIRDEKLFFCVGDVSGKGVPASLVMAVTRSIFRTVSARENSPGSIVSQINDAISNGNESNMFVTFFCGVLNLRNGEMLYCNAGHNAPFMLTDHIEKLPVKPNLPLGVIKGMSFEEQQFRMKDDDAIFLYTDGLTEAENISHELFGEERVERALHSRTDAFGHLHEMQEKVAEFVGEAPQSDDLTMLFIHFLDNGIRHHVEFRNNIEELPALASFVEKIAGEASLDSAKEMNLNLALEEAVTNVMMYAYPKGTHGRLKLEALIESDFIRFVLSDSGAPFDPTAVPEADTTLGVEERKIGGLGIFLVRKIMDSVEYRRSGGMNILTMTIKR